MCCSNSGWIDRLQTVAQVLFEKFYKIQFKIFFIKATEPHDNSGTPHALEHLIYGGSEDYPYKGVLDILANRYLSYGCNAM